MEIEVKSGIDSEMKYPIPALVQYLTTNIQ